VGLDTWRDLDNERTMDDYVYSGWGSALYWNGGIVAGAVWDMRETASIGDDLADELCFFALDRNPDEFGEMLDDILYEDDTDADVSNGTPNIDDILYAFGNHKIYPSDPDVPPPAPVIEGDLFMDYPEITWDKPSPDSKEYDIYRKIDTGSWSFLDTTSNLYYIDTDYEYFPRGDAELWYKVKAVDYDDNESNYSNTVYYDKMESTTKPIGVFRPTEYALYNAYPNPFNPSTSINYDIPKESRVTVKIFNILGITVKDYVINSQSPGWYNLTWDGTNMAGIQVPSGVYIVHFNAESLEGKRELFQQSIKVTLLR
jgi:hypothetical protein